MHPVIRIVSFVVFAAFLARADGVQLGFAALVLAGAFAVAGGAGLAPARRMLFRLRWLFASLLVIYLWFTPGPPLAGLPDSALTPTTEGARIGLHRLLALVFMVLGANLLVHATARPALLGAVYWLARPLRRLALAPERLALRMVLVMEAVGPLGDTLSEVRRRWRTREGSALAGAGEATVDLFRVTLRRAEQASCEPRSLPVLAAPPPWQWAWPLALGLGFWLLAPLG